LKFYITGIGILRFCSCDLDLDPITFIYEPDPYPLKICTARRCPQTKNELSTPRLSRVILTYTHTDIQTTGAALHENNEATAKSTSQDGGMAVNFG